MVKLGVARCFLTPVWLGCEVEEIGQSSDFLRLLAGNPHRNLGAHPLSSLRSGSQPCSRSLLSFGPTWRQIYHWDRAGETLFKYRIKISWGLFGVRPSWSHLSLPFFKLPSSGELFRFLYWSRETHITKDMLILATIDIHLKKDLS